MEDGGHIHERTREREIIDMVLAKHAIRLREIQANTIGNHAIFTNVHQVSQSTLASILKRHQVQMKQLLSVLYFQIFFPLFFFYCNCNLYWIQNFTLDRTS